MPVGREELSALGRVGQESTRRRWRERDVGRPGPMCPGMQLALPSLDQHLGRHLPVLCGRRSNNKGGLMRAEVSRFSFG